MSDSPASRPDWVDGGVAPTEVRGPRVGRTAPVHSCLHCGAPLKTEAARESGFCCSGCTYVHRLVHEQGLEGYYKIRDSVIAPVDQTVFQPRDFTWLAELQRHAEAAPAPELTLEVQGISCAGCVWLIEKIFHKHAGALFIETDAQLGRMRFRWERGKFDATEFARALQSFNYLVGPPGEEPAVPESKFLIRRIGLCAAFAMNIMLFALPAYFGMERTFAYARLFDTLAMACATFSVLAGGTYFISRAARALRDRVMHIDLPIAVGIVGSYAGSIYGWLTGNHSVVYFDFVGMFIVLMLFGRWAQVVAVERNRRRLLTTNTRPQKVSVDTPRGAVDRPVEELAVGDVYAVRSGQVIPVESQLESTAATLGTAWISGEADPREARAGARVQSGALNLSRGSVRLRALQPWHVSLLAQLLRPTGRDQYRHRLLERVVTGYLVGIFVVATATTIGWWVTKHDVALTWSAVTAVLVVSCPCAIGLAYPLADEMATVALRRFGVFVRENDLFPRLTRLRKIVFDKTGTLTLETPVLSNPAALHALSLSARAALLALVRDNPHPISQCLNENLLSDGLVNGLEPAPGEVNEETGFGVTLRGELGRWSLGRPGWLSSANCNLLGYNGGEAHDTEFACDGVVLARFKFTDAVRPGAREEIAALHAAGFETFILSGDRKEKVAAMAEGLGVKPQHAIAEATPTEKAQWLKRTDRDDTLMLGDGANDSLAFDAAFVRGTPVVHRGVLEGKADFYYLGRGLDGLRRMFAVNETRRRTQLVLIVFSIAYNCTTVTLAAFGHMNPLIAAVIMPASSLSSLLVVGIGMRRWTKIG
ncbi:MAG: heavy metal translocating P-type ATPase metal-binding domain-containing protein [Candidatus Didemnitutus sp.]|nr:heavy metal translocating P-type ATPase metal-binding domain-containing protein [Candidatus Didemnitutus sp.]